jgi:hypothetical protein
MKQKQYNLFFIKYMKRGQSGGSSDSSQQRQKFDKKYRTTNTVPYKSYQSHVVTYLHR